MHNEIPLARGLGSSAAATVGGLVAGNALLGEPLTTADLLRLATDDRGPSRTTPPRRCSAASRSAPPTDDGVEAIRFDAPRDLRAVLFIPELRLATERDARRPAGEGAAGRRGREPRPRSRSASPGWRSGRLRPAPRRSRSIGSTSSTGRRSTRSCRGWSRRPARRARSGRACPGAGSTILAFSDSMPAITRIEARVRRRRRRHRPARPDRGRVAAERRGARGQARLTVSRRAPRPGWSSLSDPAALSIGCVAVVGDARSPPCAGGVHDRSA